MCFTININTTRNAIEKRFSVETSALIDFKFNYFYRAFNNPLIPVITQEEPNKIQMMEWGLIPHWSRDIEHAEKLRSSTYNAKAETLSQKASFRDPAQKGRCWIISKGFYEWQHMSKEKIPWYISHKDQDLFAFAGVYDSWTNPDSGQLINTFSMVTTRANHMMENIHNTKKRMPVILPKEIEKQWITPAPISDETLSILQPFDEKQLSAHTIKKGISNGKIAPNDPSVLEKIDYFVNGKLF